MNTDPLSPPPDWNWQEFLGSLGRFGVQLGLERMKGLLACLSEPQQGIPVIHVAGTNGKGSVCVMLSQIFQAAGYRVGRYISPHLIDWRERIWVNGEWISATEWSFALWQVSQALANYPVELEHPTEFEVVTAAAWCYFQRQQLDCVVLEVGLGGRLDATNVGVQTEISVITSIGMDHWQRLGNTLALIAGEKAGICKPGVPVVSAPQVPEVWAVLQHKAQQLEIPLIPADPACWIEPELISWHHGSYPLSLRGDVQLINAGVALTVVQELQQRGWTISSSAIQQGLQHAHWPARLQTLRIRGQTMLADGAHNVPGAKALRQYLDDHATGSVTWLCGMLQTKDASGILGALLRPGDRLFSLPINDHSAFSPPALVKVAQQVQLDLESAQSLASLSALLDLLEQMPADSPNLVLCGSLYLIGQVMQDCLGWEFAQ